MPTTTAEGNGNPVDGVASPKKATRPSNLFPQNRLEAAVAIAEVIESRNAGQPYPPTDIAIALGKSPGSSAFHVLLSSSLKYGLTTGSYKSDRITQTLLGQSVTAPTNAEERQQALVQAALSPTTFSKAYAYYKGKKLPDTQYLMNTFVREFGIPQEQAENCSEIFRANLHFVGLIREASTGQWVSGEAGVVPAAMTDDDEVSTDGDDDSSSGERTPEVPVVTPPESPIEASEKPQRPRAIFVGHGKDKGPLTQLEKILSEYKLPYKVAKYEANAGRPIPQKVADTMGECGAAILLFTPDEELRDLDGNPVWRPSENVGHELGAASVLYDNKIVIFKESTVTLPANYSSIGYIEFEKHDLAAKAIEQFRELIAFGLVKISVGE